MLKASRVGLRLSVVELSLMSDPWIARKSHFKNPQDRPDRLMEADGISRQPLEASRSS